MNFNYFDFFNHDEFIYISQMMETKYHDIRDKDIKIVDINIAYLDQFSYNDIINKYERDSGEYYYMFF